MTDEFNKDPMQKEMEIRFPLISRLHYILVGHEPVEATLDAWARWFERSCDNNERMVANTKISDDVEVSTIFLGLDHNYSSEGPPVLFETMIFGGPEDQNTWRYCTWDEAERGHHEAVRTANAARTHLDRLYEVAKHIVQTIEDEDV